MSTDFVDLSIVHHRTLGDPYYMEQPCIRSLKRPNEGVRYKLCDITTGTHFMLKIMKNAYLNCFLKRKFSNLTKPKKIRFI